MDDYTILHGDALTMLRTLPDRSVHCAITSPPYRGLRSYGHWFMQTLWGSMEDFRPPRKHPERWFFRLRWRAAERGKGVTSPNCKSWIGALGLEPTLQMYVVHLVEVLREVRRVLRDDGTLWLNIGDSYASQGGPEPAQTKWRVTGASDGQNGGRSRRAGALKPKDLVGVPWRVAFALQDDGWWLRRDIIWAKRAPMPESVTDRPTSSHEYIFLLSKSARYYYDAEAVKETVSNGTAERYQYAFKNSGKRARTHHGDDYMTAEAGEIKAESGRNQRDVWLLSPEPYPEAHFATFPTEIPRRAILAGTSERGCCPNCGAPWRRVMERGDIVKCGHGASKKQAESYDISPINGGNVGVFRSGTTQTKQTTGWTPTCTCDAGALVPAVVLDPFLGSGTTLAVAVGLGRHGIGIELNADYIMLAERRIAEVQRPLIVAQL